MAQAAVAGCSPAFSGGSGSAVDPYLISTASDLDNLRNPTNSPCWVASAHYLQTNDIDVNATWTYGVAGNTVSVQFAGIYDGGGYEITDLTIYDSSTSSTSRAVALFGRVSGAIRNLGLSGTSTITAPPVPGSSLSPELWVGGLVGDLLSGGTISDSHSSADIVCGLTTNRCNAGGLVAESAGSVSNAYATGSVTAGSACGSCRIGGLIGWNNTGGSLSNVFASGDVTQQSNNSGGTDYVGGLVGVHTPTSPSLTAAFATGKVKNTSVSGGGYLGGLVGFMTGNAESVYAIGEVSHAGTGSVGGLAGSVSGGTFSTSVPAFWEYDAANPAAGTTQSAAWFLNTSYAYSRTGSQLTTLSTFSDASWNVASGYSAAKTWGMCSSVNAGYPFLTALYPSDPCGSTPVAAGGGASEWPVFTFQTPGGGECTAISPQHPQLNTWFTLPGADAPCYIKGSVLSGWSIPGQDWAFAPGRRVWVVDSQTFTSVLEYEWVTIEYDSNVDAKDACVANGEDLPVADRTGITHIPRNVITDQPLRDAPVCSAPGYEFLGWTTDNPYDDPTILPKDGTMPAPAVNSDGDAANVIHLYAMWKWVG